MTIIPIPKNITEFEGNYTLHYFGKILVDFKSGEAARMAASPDLKSTRILPK